MILQQKSLNAPRVTSPVVHVTFSQRAGIDRNVKSNKPHRRQNHTTGFVAPDSIPESLELPQRIKSNEIADQINQISKQRSMKTRTLLRSVQQKLSQP